MIHRSSSFCVRVAKGESLFILEHAYGVREENAMLAEVGVRFDRIPLEFHGQVYAQMYITVKGRTVFLLTCSARVKILNPGRFFIPLDRKPCV